MLVDDIGWANSKGKAEVKQSNGIRNVVQKPARPAAFQTKRTQFAKDLMRGTSREVGHGSRNEARLPRTTSFAATNVTAILE